jgi:hypothetical protein
MARRSGTRVPSAGRAGLWARFTAALRTLAERVVLGGAVGGTTALVLVWAGTTWRTSLLIGAAGCLVVVLGAWVAATVPTPGAPLTPTRPVASERGAPGVETSGHEHRAP